MRSKHRGRSQYLTLGLKTEENKRKTREKDDSKTTAEEGGEAKRDEKRTDFYIEVTKKWQPGTRRYGKVSDVRPYTLTK